MVQFRVERQALQVLGTPQQFTAVTRLRRLVLAAPTQLVTYAFRVHLATPEAPVPERGAVHLLGFRNGQGWPRWMELTPATAALLLAAQRASIGQAALDLGLADLSEAVELLAEFQRKGALLGFV